MKTNYQIAIIGTGPAGISAALSCKSRNKDFVIIGPREGSRKISLAKKVDNYLGLEGLSGIDLNHSFISTITKNAFNHISAEVNTIYSLPEGFFIELKNGSMIEAEAVVVAIGMNPSKKIKGEDTFLGNGISYCPTCDANLYKGKDVAVIGYNQEALDEAEFLASITNSVTFVNLTGKKIELSDTIKIVEEKALEFVGEDKIESLKLETTDLVADGYFVIRDAQGPDEIIPGIELDGNHVAVKRDFSTNLPGLFACGDLVGLPYQIAKAVGEGNIAGISASRFIERR